MARQTNTALAQEVPEITWRGSSTPAEREIMIREAAYYRFEKRGHVHGYDLDDWLAAEFEIDFGNSILEPVESPAPDIQQSSTHGAAADDELKRIVKQHPQKAIPRVESMEPQGAPIKE